MVAAIPCWAEILAGNKENTMIENIIAENPLSCFIFVAFV
jgi:hypothetical protein